MSIEAQAEQLRARFDGLQIRIGNSRIVHRSELCAWIGGVLIPAPQCHTGFALDPERLHATDAAADCQLCTGRRRSPGAPRVSAGQLTIDQEGQHP
ncbi:hypothetical protein [Nocardiopsis dassonvillei]|uniref:hypothetical protein n=1 Tax=Nocardiopsis dassonvillei TaxID=2014 RepID=UPI00362788BA